MQLLQEIEDRGYPADYLLSRIRGKRVSLISDWEPFLMGIAPVESLPPHYRDFAPDTSPQSEWRHLLKEFRWVYFQMNKKLGKVFSSFFLYAELRTIFFFLRYRTTNEQAKWEQLLSVSMLSKRCKMRLKRSEDIHDAVRIVEELLVSFSSLFRGTGETFIKEGLQGMERWLTNRYLEYVVTLRLHPVIKKFFIRTIDSRNLLTLYKRLRWELKAEADFVRGGSISVRKLGAADEKGDMFNALRMIQAFTGEDVQIPDATNVEKAIYTAMTRTLRREGREPSGVALILDYLWRCSTEIRNLGLVIHGEGIDRDVLRTELVL
jgi:vacuolar-type H+-ATPase subunit C/Vma6